jgi:hypothetical protein
MAMMAMPCGGEPEDVKHPAGGAPQDASDAHTLSDMHTYLSARHPKPRDTQIVQILACQLRCTHSPPHWLHKVCGTAAVEEK